MPTYVHFVRSTDRQEVLPEPAEFMAQFGHFPPTANPTTDRVIRVLPLIVYVVWNAINQQVSK